jgi:phosphate transport system permease protein
MPDGVSWARRLKDHLATALAALALLLVLLPLAAIFIYLVQRGVGSINWAFLTRTPNPVGVPGGGMANAIVGTGVILAIASAFGVPLGIGAGVFLSEYGRNRFGDAVRFTADVLNGVPSIVIGIVAYSLVVLRQKHFSALAGGVALGIMMIPTITRATEEMLLLVPRSVREAALGLGVSRWRTTVSITLRTAAAGIITGIMLAFARNQPMAALPLQIFVYAISPYDEWHRQAWAGALVLIVLIVGTIAVVRLIASRGMMKGTA